jgi:Bacterial Ig-like domain (group 1)
MAYENITLRKKNFTAVNGYFYMIDEDLDSLIVKTDDGTQAFSYPLDTVISQQVSSLEYDGRNFWTLENLTGTNIRIRKWYLDNYVLKLRTTFNLNGGGTHSYESDAFTVEHYHETFTGNEAAGQSILSISNGSKMSSGMTVTLGPNSSGQIEEATVNSAGADFVQINGTTTYAYETGDPLTFFTNIWIFNDYDGLNLTGALYKFSAYTGSLITKYSGGAYADVNACTFYDMSDVYGADSDAICYVKGTNTIFLDPDDINNSFGSMVMDNVQDDNATVIPIYDLAIEGDNVYRLQLKATYYGTTYAFADTNYSYQLSTLNPFITSISLAADPAILPADLVSSSQITAIVKDQFLQPIASKLVYFTDDDSNGYIVGSPATTNSNGVCTVSYVAGSTANEVKITATAQQ